MTNRAPAIAVTLSSNSKIGLMAATYASQVTCPKTCPLRGRGCYTERGAVNIHLMRLNKAATNVHANALTVARAEVLAIQNMAIIPNLPLRGHVVGDCPTAKCAEIVGDAYRSYMQRGGGRAYSYTHAYLTVPRKAWGPDISILASCESLDQVKAARRMGYHAAVLLVKEKLVKATTIQGIKILPCSHALRGTFCSECKLCLREDFLAKSGAVVAFEATNRPALEAVLACSDLDPLET
jgi:hypothetical protein